jgi:hypothetical protein
MIVNVKLPRAARRNLYSAHKSYARYKRQSQSTSVRHDSKFALQCQRKVQHSLVPDGVRVLQEVAGQSQKSKRTGQKWECNACNRSRSHTITELYSSEATRLSPEISGYKGLQNALRLACIITLRLATRMPRRRRPQPLSSGCFIHFLCPELELHRCQL